MSSGLVADKAFQEVRVALAFGTSMAPAINPGAEISLEIPDPKTLRCGDILMVEFAPGILVTHRLVKIIASAEGTLFQTKGDNRIHCDAPVTPDKILGRVVCVNGTNVRSSAARILAQGIAFFSYGQAALCRLLKVPESFRPMAARLINPVLWGAHLQQLKERLRVQRLRGKLLSQGILWENSVPEAQVVTELWNDVFSNYPTTAARLERFIFQSPRFRQSKHILVKRAGRLWAWVLLSQKEEGRGTKAGVVDIYMVSEEAKEAQLEPVLFQEILDYFHAQKIKRVYFNPYPVTLASAGISTPSFLAAASALGFDPSQLNQELTVTRENFRAMPEASASGCRIKPFEEKDIPAMIDFLNRNVRQEPEPFLDLTSSSANILMALAGDHVVAACRWIPESQIKDCADAGWLWVVSNAQRRRGYFFRLIVDREFRGRSIGTALAAQAFRLLFEAGCEEIVLLVLQDGLGHQKMHFYERFGFKKTGTFLKLRYDEKN